MRPQGFSHSSKIAADVRDWLTNRVSQGGGNEIIPHNHHRKNRHSFQLSQSNLADICQGAQIGENLSKASRRHGKRGRVLLDSNECNHNAFHNPVRRGFDVPRNGVAKRFEFFYVVGPQRVAFYTYPDNYEKDVLLSRFSALNNPSHPAAGSKCSADVQVKVQRR